MSSRTANRWCERLRGSLLFFTVAAVNAVLFSCGVESLVSQSGGAQFSYESIERIVNQAPSLEVRVGAQWNMEYAPMVTYTISPDLPSEFTLNARSGEIAGIPLSPIFTTHIVTATIEEGATKQARVSILLKLKPSSKAELLEDLESEIERQGLNANLITIDTSLIDNMDGLFNPSENPFTEEFNGDLSSWDVTNVISMDQMFCGAEAFNQDLGSWNVSKVESMDAMFAGALEFNKDIGSWAVENVQNMDYMFYDARVFTQDLEVWAVADNVTMNLMFENSGMKGNTPSWYH